MCSKFRYSFEIRVIKRKSVFVTWFLEKHRQSCGGYMRTWYFYFIILFPFSSSSPSSNFSFPFLIFLLLFLAHTAARHVRESVMHYPLRRDSRVTFTSVTVRYYSVQNLSSSSSHSRVMNIVAHRRNKFVICFVWL